MNYWLDLFTGRTWKEFQAAGSKVSGFREHNWARARGVKPGDVFLCYLVGVKRWVGLLEVRSERYRNDTKIFSEENFPVRFDVAPIVILTPEHGVPMESLAGKLSFYRSDTPPGRWSGHVRSSPTRYRVKDGDTIAAAIRDAEANPRLRPVDQKALERSANLYKLRSNESDEKIEAVVSVPSADEDEIAETTTVGGSPSHSQIQWQLLDLGSKMGLSVWAPKNDRGKTWNSRSIGSVARMLNELPTQFDAATNKTVENIDALWLSGQAIVAAFEVEHSTSIYSGLLRMSDLLTMQPNLVIRLYLVGPDDRFEKYAREVARPTFSSRKKPLYSMCRFLPYSVFVKRLVEVQHVLTHMKPEFLDDIAISYDPADEIDS